MSLDAFGCTTIGTKSSYYFARSYSVLECYAGSILERFRYLVHVLMLMHSVYIVKRHLQQNGTGTEINVDADLECAYGLKLRWN